MHRDDRPRFDVQSSFFDELPPGGLADLFPPLDIPARDAPQPCVRALHSPAKEDRSSLIADDDCHPDSRVSVLDKAADAVPSLAAAPHAGLTEIAIGPLAEHEFILAFEIRADEDPEQTFRMM